MSFLISKVEEQKKNTERFNIFTDDGFLTSLSIDAVIQYGIKEGTIIPEDKLDEIKKEDTVKYAKEKAMEYIAYSPRSGFQVRQKLKQKGIDDDSIEETMKALEYYHYVDDAEFVREFAKSYKGKLGRKAIVQKLKEKGVDAETIDDNLILDEDEQRTVAKQTAENIVSKNRGLDQYKLKQKIYQTLTRKGFSYDMISSVTEEILDENFF